MNPMTSALPLPFDDVWPEEEPPRSSTHRTRDWHPPIAMLGVPFDNVTTEQAVEIIEDMVASRRPHYLATANVDFTVQALRDPELRRILLDAHLVVCDGMPLVWASKWLGNPLRERVAGSDLVPLLLEVAERKGYRVFFLGGQKDIARRAVANAVAKHPGLKVAGVHSPPFAPLSEMDHNAICKRVRDSGADLLFVSFGCPKQEKWIAMNYQRCGTPVTIGVGATIDFLAGSMKRAPRWMQVTGMEWAFRLAQEPRRLFKRYATDLVVFGTAIARQVWQLRGQPRGDWNPSFSPAVDILSNVLPLPKRLDAIEVRDEEATWQFVLEHPHPCILDASALEFVDSTGVGLLVRLRKSARENGNRLIIANTTPALKRVLSLMKLDGLFEQASSLEEARRKLDDTDAICPVGSVNADHDEGSGMAWQHEVIATNVDEVWKLCDELISGLELRGGGTLTINLATLGFADTAGIGLMVRVKKQGAMRGVLVEFVHPSSVILALLRVLRLDTYLLKPTSGGC